MKMENHELVTLLNVANDLRDSTLSDLPISEPESANHCLVARAFNYNCEVEPSHKGGNPTAYPMQIINMKS